MGENMIPSELPSEWRFNCKCQVLPALETQNIAPECPIGGIADIDGGFYIVTVGNGFGYWATNNERGLAIFRQRIDAIEFGARIWESAQVAKITFDDAFDIVKKGHQSSKAEYVFIMASKNLKLEVVDKVFVPID